MNRRLIVSLSIIGVVAAVAIGATIAYYNDTETSPGNILIAGTMDLKVDHLRQTYNGIDCNTCSITLISDTSHNMVVANSVNPISTPYPAVYVGSNPPYFIHDAWTAEDDPTLKAAGAKWIWATDPTLQEDTTNNVIYTFQNKFEWWGPIVGSDLWFAIGSDNSVEVWLNGNKIGENTGEFGYKKESMLHILGASVTPFVLQGDNVLEFKVKNWALPNGDPFSNPGGLIYKFSIDGMCQDNFFKSHCMLWGLKDLTGQETFFNFDDVKPGDYGTNIISMHVFGNNAYGCLLATAPIDNENVCVGPEINAHDTTCGTGPTDGELSQFLSAVIWMENNPHNNSYDSGETILYGPASLKDMKNMIRLPLTATSTAYIGLAWCLGTQTVDANGIHCSGVGNQDVAQTDSFLASLTAYAEQQRNNAGFNCANVQLPVPQP